MADEKKDAQEGPAQSLAQQRISYRFFIADRVTALVGLFARCLTLVALAYILYKCVDSAAGKQTNFVFDFLLKADIGRWLCYVIIVAMGFTIRRERKLRKESVGREHKRVEGLEKRIDPSRTGSGLDESDNPPEVLR